MITLPETKNKVAVLFTGGVESYLLGRLCVDKYGKENVVFVSWHMNQYNVFYKNTEKMNRVKDDFIKSVENVGGSITLIVDNEKYMSQNGYMAPRTIKIIRSEYPDVDYIFGGYNNVHKESYEIFLRLNALSGDRKKLSQDARLEVFSNREKYPELFEFLTQCDGMVYFVEEDFTAKTPEDLVSFSECQDLIAPFYDLTKTQVVELYNELGMLDELYKSNSCNRHGHTKHCGVCRNCLSRRVAIKNAGFEDKTEYLC
jgi:hypothetical protein